MTLVHGSGPSRARIALVGEAPGKVEAQTGIPFSGPSGRELDRYLSQAHVLNPALGDSPFAPLQALYRTNLVKVYREGNPEPTDEDVAHWGPYLLDELARVQPEIILAIGRHSSKFFLGDDIPSLDLIHGIPHRPRTGRGICLGGDRYYSPVIIPLFHPARGLWNYEHRSTNRYGYELAGMWVDWANIGLDIPFRYDPFDSIEDYRDVSGKELSDILSHPSSARSIIGLDTEDIPSIQISLDPGTGLLLRGDRDPYDFHIGVSSIQSYLSRHRPTIALHDASTPKCACYDVVECRKMGLELQGYEWFNTMYFAYLLRLESKSNKTLAERFQGMEMTEYSEIVGDISRDKQIQYLNKALSISASYSKPSKRREKGNDGIYKESQPKHISTTIEAILRDITNGKVTKDGETNPFTRWTKLSESNPEQVKMVTSDLGPIPIASLRDIDPDRARYYSCRDSDATLRNAVLFSRICDYNPRLSNLMTEGMRFLPIIESMQSNGIPVSISAIRSLYDEMDSEVDTLVHELSRLYWDGKPFNFKSPPMANSLCRRLGLKPSLRTKTGISSTSEKSIGEFRYTEPAIQMLFDCRQRQHNRDTYCADVLSRVPDNYTSDTLIIHANFNPIKIPTRRLATSDPNVLGIPTRTELGRKVRHCYIAPPGKIFAGYDLSGIEVRCLAHLSQDPLWIETFRLGIHPHKATAKLLFNLPSISSVSDLQKAVAKTINFLIIYGGGPSNLYDQFRTNNILGYTLDDCRAFIRKWWSTYKGVDNYRQQVAAELRQTEMSVDAHGMVRYLPGINSGVNELQEEAIRIAISQKVSGLARGAIIKSSIWLDNALQPLISSGLIDPQCQRLDIHDELVFLINEGEEQYLEPLVMEALVNQSGVDLIVPIDAEAHYGYTWGDLK